MNEIDARYRRVPRSSALGDYGRAPARLRDECARLVITTSSPCCATMLCTIASPDLTTEEMRAQELREARAAAEAASAAKSEFLASMSHELHTPMNAILRFAQLLQRDRREPLSERHKECVGHILTGGEHLLRLIDDVLDLARIEAGRVSVHTESVQVMTAMEDVRKTLEPLATRNGVSLTIEPCAAGSSVLALDRTRFAQILVNLGSNAIKYKHAGGHVISSPQRHGWAV